MAGDRFPYNLPGRQALVRLINETYPQLNLKPRGTAFKEPFFAPTVQTPGRTFIQAENTDTNTNFWFVFRRLNLGVLFPSMISVNVEGLITPRKIVQEINRSYSMTFDETDTLMIDTGLVPLGHSVTYRMRAKTGSFVWFGSMLVDVVPINLPTNIRYTEDDHPRFLENGDFRYME